MLQGTFKYNNCLFIVSLVSTIKSVRPELLIDYVSFNPKSAFTIDPPQHIVDKYNFGIFNTISLLLAHNLAEIPDFGIPMLAMYTPQAESFDPTDWYASSFLLVLITIQKVVV